MDLKDTSKLKSDRVNHATAEKFPQHIEHYLKTEIEHGAMLGPFKNPPIDLHTSPFLTREKSDSENRRVIVDLSWPLGNSVNDMVDPDTYVGLDFMLTLPSIDDITNKVKKFGKNCFLAKIDVSRAFKHVPIDPKDIKFLGLHWKDFYIEKNLVFGFKFGSQIFQRLSDTVRYIMAQENHHILSYIDDHVIFGNKIQCQNYWKS